MATYRVSGLAQSHPPVKGKDGKVRNPPRKDGFQGTTTAQAYAYKARIDRLPQNKAAQ